MDIVRYAKHKIKLLENQIANIRSGGFPHEHSRKALFQLEQELHTDLFVLNQAEKSDNERFTRDACLEIQRHLYEYLPIVGFLLRSTNVRNAFEFHDPLVDLGRKLLQTNHNIIFSSEWEFSPFTYRPFGCLKDFVLVGLPASESASPLILPTSGHEIGHHVWRIYDVAADVNEEVSASIEKYRKNNAPPTDRIKQLLDDIANPEALVWEKQKIFLQCEELFCDYVGVWVFGSAFLNAFHYLLSPAPQASASPAYPPLKFRSETLVKALSKFYKEKPPSNLVADFSHSFLPYQIPGDPVEVKYTLELINHCVFSIQDAILDRTEQILRSNDVPKVRFSEAKRIYCQFRDFLIPASDCDNIAEIISAGWMARADANMWSKMPNIVEQKYRILDDLILKSIEVMEFEKRAATTKC